MFNKLKHLSNSVFKTSFSVDVIVNSPKEGHYFGFIAEIPKTEELLFIYSLGSDYEIISIDSVIKVGDVYHIKSGNLDYTVRIM
jgi:hypothetical protein